MSFTPSRVESRFSDRKGVTTTPAMQRENGIRIVGVKWEEGSKGVAQTQDLVFRGVAR